MFEKEAEENGFGLGCTVNPTKAWQNGAEYGYNKAKEEASNLIEELASSLSVVGECGEEECELINKAQKFINKPIF